MVSTLAVFAALLASAPEPEPPPESAPDTEEAPEAAPTDEAPPVDIPTGPSRAAKKDFNAPWRQGRSRLGISGGAVGFDGTSNDFYLGASYGYFVVDNLELAVDTVLTFGDSPFTWRVGPMLTFIVPVESEFQPYLGGFYRHWFIADSAFLDQDTLGGKLGVVIRSSGVFFQLGVVIERTVSQCDADCTAIYPELGLSLGL